MSPSNVRDLIADALAAGIDQDCPDAATVLLDTLGYHSELIPLDQSGDVGDFVRVYPARHPDTRSEKEFLDHAESVQILFQFTGTEIQVETQQALFDTVSFDTGNARSFLFTAVQLRGGDYTRGRYATFTRELNKRIRLPSVVLFRTANNRVTLAFVHRRPNKHNPERDVLGSVSLIREIDPSRPHRAHLDILEELSLPARLKWMDKHGKPHNFDGLLDAWLAALDTEELNKQFYRKLYRWFEHSLEIIELPTGQAKTCRKKEHVVRLITRLMFVWFIKEKGLVAEDLFIENRVAQLLKDYDRDCGDSYYRAVLQNLFFATLNMEIPQRRFSNQTHNDHRNPTLYRYRDEISEPERLLDLFRKTPFINGGLFDCLDNRDSQDADSVHVDCFTDNPKHRAGYSIPNRLFFGNHAHLGLIDLFQRYKFTVEENTPTEQEVALDPELLGKVFENLLAAINPETQRNARKETGSYYTPRAVVDYMVNEALLATLAQKAAPDDGDADFWEDRLRYLLDYDDAFADAEDLFTPTEQEAVVCAVSSLKVLDPAVGSGAFPMGVLHKLTLALCRLDPHNQLWETLQKELAGRRAAAAFDTEGQVERESELADISRTFEKYRDSNFGRKLYLIQNSIYGVDIQPIATQIAKLRFFISLAIEQQASDDPTDNYGIRPLPNLETRFVAADTLMPLYNLQHGLISDHIRELEEDLRKNRERHFHASTRSQKEEHRRTDKNLRLELASELQVQGLDTDDANKVAQWDPYDQNADAAQWFDTAYMFGFEEGFDIIIGNPPYKQITKGTYPQVRFPFSEGRDRGKQNLYKMFVEQSYNLCKNSGIATLIVAKQLMCDLSSAGTRLLLLEHTRLRHIIEFPERAPTRDRQVFNSVTQGTCIYQFHKAPPNGQPVKISVGNDTETIANPRFAEIDIATILFLWPDLRCFPHVGESDIAILKKITNNNSIKPLRHYAVSINQGDFNLNTHKDKFSNVKTPVQLLRGEHVSRFAIRYDHVNEYCNVGFKEDKVEANRHEMFLVSQEVVNQQSFRRLNVAVTTKSENRLLWGHTVNKTQLREQSRTHAFLGLLNSKFLDWYFRITSSNNHVSGYELEQLPVPAMSVSDSECLSKLVDRVLKAKAFNLVADTSAVETKIDRLVYALYGLTDAEVAVVAGK